MSMNAPGIINQFLNESTYPSNIPFNVDSKDAFSAAQRIINDPKMSIFTKKAIHHFYTMRDLQDDRQINGSSFIEEKRSQMITPEDVRTYETLAAAQALLTRQDLYDDGQFNGSIFDRANQAPQELNGGSNTPPIAIPFGIDPAAANQTAESTLNVLRNESPFQQMEIKQLYMQAVQQDLVDNGVIDGTGFITMNKPNVNLHDIKERLGLAANIVIVQKDLADDGQINGSVFNKTEQSNPF